MMDEKEYTLKLDINEVLFLRAMLQIIEFSFPNSIPSFPIPKRDLLKAKIWEVDL